MSPNGLDLTADRIVPGAACGVTDPACDGARSGPHELEGKPDGPGCPEVAQLDRNEALRGPPPGAVERVRSAIARGQIYPHEAAARARAAAAAHLGVEPGQAILTTGVDEAADLCILELGDPYTITPGFDGYGDRAAALNHRSRAFPLTDEHALPEELIGAVGEGRLVMVASPNNPTANRFAPHSLTALLRRSAYLMLDETYADFCAHAPGMQWLAEHPRLVVFRSFSKAYGLAGLRIGCLAGEERLIGRLRARQAYLTTSGLAAEALIGALESDPDFPRRHAREVGTLRAELIARLRALELFQRVHDSETNFVFVTCASPAAAATIRETLAARWNVIVASTAPLGAPAGLRIGVSLKGDADRLIAGLTAIAQLRTPVSGGAARG
ncbi:MAG TPA: aminotransferase class I/II-fold pyridoxal phosphate-dependent enzyme [Solirubrobacteraceae bacterium]|jgi:histidinol-phosphate/aromatic aminotransferase/cobyric acid decarboxylase-like protein|nr:aminotransferase class I/II-fold pyridoxal phosphate-dependent enzyme [Solirubrobacteraceae bacterium]